MMSTKQPLTRRRLRSTSTSLRNLLCQKRADEARRKMAAACRGVACREKVLDEALAPGLKKLIAIGAGTSRENSAPEEDARLQAASEALDEIHVLMKEFIAENTGRR
jgi:hypothetical protein